ncbi:hypothetical protein BGX30_000316 [Mortierella sp. GBA39]|nr:hypothetical protein BGX30_000316 [Mortierella sp. GBA39]
MPFKNADLSLVHHYLKNELGFDAAFNYKTQDRRHALTELALQELDIYYDRVFDDTVEVALDLLNTHGRIISVGALAMYQGQELVAPKNLIHILMKQLRYMVYEYYVQGKSFWKEVTPLVKSGEIKFAETVPVERELQRLLVDMKIKPQYLSKVLD